VCDLPTKANSNKKTAQNNVDVQSSAERVNKSIPSYTLYAL